MRGASVAMKWLRSNARRLSLLALFALAVQLGLSFGHFHADQALASPTAFSDHASASAPNTGHDQDNPNDFCAICATVAMANTLVDAAPPVLPAPVSASTAKNLPDLASQTADSRRVAFQSRAPPRS
jgi:hypothetical protein